MTRIVPVVVRSNNGWFEVGWVSKRAKEMRGMVCLLYSHTSRPHFPRRTGSASTVAAAGSGSNGSDGYPAPCGKGQPGVRGRGEGCVRLQNLYDMWIEAS